ncbi:iron-containing alcohol dehydrogenase family protein [Candidatus Margulisiibacteriota bacterium]
MSFKFKVSTNLRYGVSESEKLGEEIKALGFLKPGVIIDQGVFEHPQTMKILGSMKNAGLSFEVFKNNAVEPDYDFLDLFKKNFANKDFDCLVGVGGGSVLDLTKAMATLITNPGPAVNYKGFPDLNNRPLPVIAVPTTAGTGSEVTYNAVFTDSKLKKKLGINSELNYPVLSVIDPLFTVGCPKSVTVSAGCDALVHTLESYVHKNNTPLSRMLSKEAFRLLFNNLNKVLDSPDDIEVRGNIALGAYLAGKALINAGSGPSGAFSYPLGAVYKVPHGYAGAVFLPHITRINVEKGYRDYTPLYDLIDGLDITISDDQKNIEFVKKIQELMDKLDVPKSLSTYKLGPKDIEFMIEQHDVLKAAIAQNPIEITKDDTRKMMQQLR